MIHQQQSAAAGTGQPTVSHRLEELLGAIKQEFESVASEASAYRMHKDDFDHKCEYFAIWRNYLKSSKVSCVYDLVRDGGVARLFFLFFY
jgi:hypothetical protein